MSKEIRQITVNFENDNGEVDEYRAFIEYELTKERYGEDADGNRGTYIYIPTNEKVVEIIPDPLEDIRRLIEEAALENFS